MPKLLYRKCLVLGCLQNVGSSDHWFAGCDGRVHTSCVRIKERPRGCSNSSRWRVGQKIAWSKKITGRTRFQGFSTTHIGSQHAFYQTTFWILVLSRLPIQRLGNLHCWNGASCHGCHGFDLDFNRHKKSDQKVRYSYWHANENWKSEEWCKKFNVYATSSLVTPSSCNSLPLNLNFSL